MNIRRRRWAHVILTAAALTILVGYVGYYATSKENGTRVRNSFLLDSPAPVAEFNLAPIALPDSFLLEQDPAASYLIEVTRELQPATDENELVKLAQATAIAAHLIANKAKGKPIQSTVSHAYRDITESGLGYCADYSQVFTALALASGLDVREWGLGFDGFGRGHAFNEIYEPKLAKWIFIDSYHSLYVVDAESREPLSVIEFHERLMRDSTNEGVLIKPIEPSRFRFDSDVEAIEYYRRGKNYFYLFWGNNVFSYDNHPVVKLLGPVSRSLEILGAIALGVQPKIRVLQTPENVAATDRLRSIAAFMFAALALALALVALLIFHLSRIRRINR